MQMNLIEIYKTKWCYKKILNGGASFILIDVKEKSINSNKLSSSVQTNFSFWQVNHNVSKFKEEMMIGPVGKSVLKAI